MGDKAFYLWIEMFKLEWVGGGALPLHHMKTPPHPASSNCGIPYI